MYEASKNSCVKSPRIGLEMVGMLPDACPGPGYCRVVAVTVTVWSEPGP